MTAYYNEIDPYAAEWLRNLIAAGHIAPGDVDERDIRDVRPDDLAGYTQCHFFAGIGVWSYSLRLAGWPDDRPVWTGSCPCQPFSAAGKGGGFDDERHLWPFWHHLVRERRPVEVLGEQVASKDGLGWLDLVQADLEGEGYAVAAVDTCSAGSGAPHIRQRLRFGAQRLEHAPVDGRIERRPQPGERGIERGRGAGGMENPELPARARHRQDSGQALRDEEAMRLARGSVARGLDRAATDARLLRREDGGVADADGRDASAEGLQRGGQHGQQPEDGSAGRVADAERFGREWRRAGEARDAGREQALATTERPRETGGARRPGPTNGFWRDADWLFCRDGKWRPVEPGTFPLAHGASARVGRLRAYGNAVDAQATKHFIEAWLDAADFRLTEAFSSSSESVFE